MRWMLHAKFPHEHFNAAVRDGTMGARLNQLLETLKPESIYFTEFDGRRSALMVVDIEDSHKIPFYAEPWFLLFNADVEFHPAITPADLKKADLDNLAKSWA